MIRQCYGYANGTFPLFSCLDSERNEKSISQAPSRRLGLSSLDWDLSTPSLQMAVSMAPGSSGTTTKSAARLRRLDTRSALGPSWSSCLKDAGFVN